MTTIKLSWTDFKNLVIAQKFQIQMLETSASYTLTAFNFSTIFRSDILKTVPASADQIDFESNFKNISNFKIKNTIEGDVEAITNTVESVYRIVAAANGSNINANVSGTLGVPVNFRVTIGVGETWYLDTLTFLLNDNANFANTGLGGQGAVTNGIQINVRTKGVVQNLTTIRNNYDLIKTFTKDVFSSVAVGLLSTDRTYRGSVEFKNRITLNEGDYVELKIQDNLTGLTGVFLDAVIWRES